MLHSGENRQKICIGVASVITLACSDFARPDLGPTPAEGYVRGDEHIRFKRWLPMNYADRFELLEIVFEAILPGRLHRHYSTTNDICNDTHYSKILTETTMMPSNISKLLRVDFCGQARTQNSE